MSDQTFAGPPTKAGIDALAGVVLLLHAAAFRTDEIATERGSTDPYNSLHAAELQMAAFQAGILLGQDFDYLPYPEPLETDPVRLVEAAADLLAVEPLPATATLAEQIQQLLGLPVELVSRRAIKPNKLKYIEQDLIYV